MKQVALFFVVSGLASGCGSKSDSSACKTASTGVVQVDIVGLPEGANAKAWLSKGSSVYPITGNSDKPQLLQLDSGEYTVGVSTVTISDPIVRLAYAGTVSASSLEVCDGTDASLNVSYNIIPSSHRLWWGDTMGSSNTVAFDAESLRVSADVSASLAIQTAGTLPGAFDILGNLWVVDSAAGVGSLKRYSVYTFAADGMKSPDIVITSSELSGDVAGAASLAFDSSGNLWVGVVSTGKVVEFDVSHLGASGDVTPDVEITNVPSPNALAFDATHDLWVGAGDNVIAYNVARLSASTADPADISLSGLTSGAGALSNVLGLAFTSTQDLWVNWNGTFAFIESDELKSGALTPAIQITTDAPSPPQGLVLDESGALWFPYGGGKFAKLSKTQLGESGTVSPTVIISSSDIGEANSPAFFPAAAGLPLYSSLPL
ncbi:MAG TPA: hypothetical protein VK745_22645 [Polyangiaceae bacterium]|jgi:hypothetical protein|nr:hypothetical protein [Polyangiaceae bacterium]